MAAAITVSPESVEEGEAVSVLGSGFEPGDTVSIKVPQLGLTSQIVADAAGYIGSNDIADHAAITLTAAGNALDRAKPTAVLTSDGTSPADGATVTINDVVYRFKDTMAQANDVKRDAVSNTCLDHLIAAVNGSGTEGVEYYADTVQPTDVTAAARAGTGATATVTFTAAAYGTTDNSFASTETSAHNAFSNGATFSGGKAADTVTLDDVTYTFKDTPTTAFDVKIGVDAATTLSNLKKAVNGTGVEGTNYYAGTDPHETVTALTLTTTTLLFYVNDGGTAGNSIVSTEVSPNLSFDDTTFDGGASASGVSALILDFENAGTYKIEASDESDNEAETHVVVFTK